MQANFLSVEPILSVPDVEAAVDWWTRHLAATNGWYWRDEPDAEVSHGGCRLGRAAVQFSLEPDAAMSAAGPTLFFNTGLTSSAALDAYADVVRTSLGVLQREPVDCPWGLREFQVLDPQGRVLRFAGPTQPPQPRLTRPFDIESRKPTANEWVALARSVGWTDIPTDRADEVIDGMRHGIVAVGNGETIGCVLILSNGVKDAYFSDVAVRPDWQGVGIGSAMMRAALDWCGKQLVSTADLSLATGRGTSRFYEQFGFRGSDEGGPHGMFRRNG